MPLPASNSDTQSTALADWKNNFGETRIGSSIPDSSLHLGDRDGDGDVDGADFLTWQYDFSQSFSTTEPPQTIRNSIEATVDNSPDGADLIAWQDNFGAENPIGPLFGDSDSDLDVDGADFLAWQRNFITMSAEDFTDNSLKTFGDFNNDQLVDHVDESIWRSNFSSLGLSGPIAGDADGDLDVDGADFLIWQRSYGTTLNDSYSSPASALAEHNNDFDDFDETESLIASASTTMAIPVRDLEALDDVFERSVNYSAVHRVEHITNRGQLFADGSLELVTGPSNYEIRQRKMEEFHVADEAFVESDEQWQELAEAVASDW